MKRGLKVSVIVPSLTGEVPAGVLALGDAVELVVVKGVCPVSAARNEGLSRATGDYVAWVDADDDICPEWLDEIGRALADGPDIVTFNVRVTWEDGSGRAPYSLDGRRTGQLWCKVFRRSLFNGLRFAGNVHEDWRIQCEMPKDVRRVHIDKILYRYRRTATGLSQHRDVAGELAALWGLLRICNSREMFRGICERAWDLAKTPARSLKVRRSEGLKVRSSSSMWMVDARTFASRPTGVGMYAYRLVRRMLDEEEKGSGKGERRTFVLVCDVKESAEIRALEAAGCEVREYGRRVYNSLGVIGYFGFVKRAVAVVRPDVFWQPNNLQPFRVRGARRVIVTIHDVFGLGWCGRYWLWHLYYRFSFWRTMRNVTEVWYNSHETEVHVRAVAGRRLDGLATKVTHPLTDAPRREDVRPYPHERPYFLYLGNVEKRKGADILFDAYARYRAEGGTADLVVAGPERNVVLPKAEGVTALGYVDEETKYSLLCSAAALVVPSRAEGYGMQVAEAVALDVTCLASDLSVFREIDPTGKVTYLRGFCAGTDAVRLQLLTVALHATPLRQAIPQNNFRPSSSS